MRKHFPKCFFVQWLRRFSWHIGCSPSVCEHQGVRGDPDRKTGREEDQVAKEDRGFASMDRNKQREIASKGGKAAHQKGTAHEWTSEEAREAGRKGGMASHRRRELTGSEMTGEGMQNLESSDLSERDDESNEQIR